jgi:hypothetical protein
MKGCVRAAQGKKKEEKEKTERRGDTENRPLLFSVRRAAQLGGGLASLDHWAADHLNDDRHRPLQHFLDIMQVAGLCLDSVLRCLSPVPMLDYSYVLPFIWTREQSG